jgi:hypothetical protein
MSNATRIHEKILAGILEKILARILPQILEGILEKILARILPRILAGILNALFCLPRQTHQHVNGSRSQKQYDNAKK